MSDRADEHVVHEAVGPALTPLEAAGALGVGVNSLLVLGVIPVLLGALVDEHRITDPDIGLVVMAEVLSMGVATAMAGALLKPMRLKTIGIVTTLLLAALDLATARASGTGVFVLRGLAGAIEGVMLWITVAMISRTTTPERWAGVFFVAQTLAQLLLALALAVWIMPLWGANGGFISIAVCAIAALPAAMIGPSRLADLNPGEAIAGSPSFRGWVALIGTLVFVAGGGAVAAYLQPLAQQAGLDAGVARTALWVSLAAQVAGSAAATALAGRVRWFHVFLITTTTNLVVWWLFGQHIAAWLFIGANTVAGFTSLLLSPFLVPMTIDADPSRRAAVQSGAAQLIGGALGPLLASRVVSDQNVHGVLWLGASLLLPGLAIVAWLHFTHRSAVEG
ncbi:MAG TPA: MFS transporter [Caulobacteraceae bacterium]|nr:MFS transporter [Caulobacteraceae bacterium]